ncbi:MAG: circularly permuted type 2 ATP-grasp protein [bacterium]|nr:circularly permuted type 2 ATP-grasp protein [bacterium]
MRSFRRRGITGLLQNYEVGSYYDEMFDAGDGVRPGYRTLNENISRLSARELSQRKHAIERAFYRMGITFNVYDQGDEAMERILPFDIIPRVVQAREWERIERGLKQRTVALNLFIQDIYNDQKILKDGVIPRAILESSRSFLRECMGLRPPRDVWTHISGTDLIRHDDGEVYVLEDNLRCPSGVAYMIENRESMKRTFAELFNEMGVRPIYDYPMRLLQTLQSMSERESPRVVVLTPGVYNSAYFEHSFLARQMGVQLVEGKDLAIVDDYVQMRTTRGFERVDVIYRRIDDVFLDPRAFRPDSMLGVPGLFDVYRKGRVVLANAPGTGLADDKVLYAYVPRIIKYYLDEEIELPNVPTYVCEDQKDRDYVIENIDSLVVKAANEAGGYGMLIGPHASKQECDKFRDLVRANPRNYIAQPTLSLSRVPTLVDDPSRDEGVIEGRHVDLRPFILYGEDVHVVPGGLTRVALKKGSLVVNSSQGGGSKDTWVLLQ